MILVATHADLACKDDSGGGGGFQNDPEGLLTELQDQYDTDLIIESHMFVIDSLTTSGQGITLLKRAITDIKQFICEVCACVQ